MEILLNKKWVKHDNEEKFIAATLNSKFLFCNIYGFNKDIKYVLFIWKCSNCLVNYN